MQYHDIELYNVSDTLTGDALQVLGAEQVEWLRVNNPLDIYATLAPETSEGLWLSRLPDVLRRSINPIAQLMGLSAAGCELRFNLKSPQARITLRNALTPPIVASSAFAEIYQGPFLMSWQIIGREPTTLTIVRPPNLAKLERLARAAERGRGAAYTGFDPQLTRVVLPLFGATRILEIEGDFEPPRPTQTPACQMLCYGSSITHGAMALHPSGAYVARLAAQLGVDMYNLGFGGGAHLEPAIADHIAARTDWDLATLELGINMVRNTEVAEFATRVQYMLSTVARAHPDRWIYCIDLFRCQLDPQLEPKLARYRRVVREAVQDLNMPRVVHVPGLRLLPCFGGLTTDMVHPAPAGMEAIATNLARIIRRHAKSQG